MVDLVLLTQKQDDNSDDDGNGEGRTDCLCLFDVELVEENVVVLVKGVDVEGKERRLGMLGGEREFVCRKGNR